MIQTTQKYFAAFFLLCSIILFAHPLWAEEEKKIADTVAIVNGTVITRMELERELFALEQKYLQEGQQPGEKQLDAMKEEILDQIIAMKLLYQESKKRGITISESDLANEMANLKSSFNNENDYQNMLEQLHLDEKALENDLREKMAVNQFVRTEVLKEQRLSDEELRDFYEQTKETMNSPARVRASHILIKLEPDADAETKEAAMEKIRRLQKQLKDGADFAELAKRQSEGPSSINGGDLGYFSEGRMVKPFSEAAFALAPGEVSDVVTTQFGYHLIKLVDKREAGILPFDEVKDDLESFLGQEKARVMISQYIDALKKKEGVSIKIFESAE